MTLEEKKSKTLTLDNKKELLENVSSLRNVGYLALKPILNKLNLNKVCSALEAKYKCENSIYDVLSFLTYSQIIDPSSKQSSYLKRSRFFENYNFSEDQMYNSLSYLGKSFESIKDYIYRELVDNFKIDTSTTFYDGTNFYFEINKEDNFRKKGPSKEKRVKPLVSVGLLMDSNGIPIDIKIYPGNESEKPHFNELIKEMKEKRKITGKTIYVADKGLNTSNNIFEAYKNGDGYIFSKQIKNAKEDLKKYIDSEYGFEDFIKVKKHFLKIRPVFLRREERIITHILVAFLAVVLLRLLENQILNDKFSTYQIINSLREYQCAMITPNNYFFFQYDKVIRRLGELSGSNVKLESQTLSAIKTLFKNY